MRNVRVNVVNVSGEAGSSQSCNYTRNNENGNQQRLRLHQQDVRVKCERIVHDQPSPGLCDEQT